MAENGNGKTVEKAPNGVAENGERPSLLKVLI